MKLSLGEEKARKPSGERCEISKGGLSPPLPSFSSYFSSYFSFLLSTTTLEPTGFRRSLSLAGKMKNGFLSGRCATFLSSGRINYGTPDRRESWGGSWGYLQTCSNENNALWGCSKASRASYTRVLNLSLIVIAFCL